MTVSLYLQYYKTINTIMWYAQPKLVSSITIINVTPQLECRSLESSFTIVICFSYRPLLSFGTDVKGKEGSGLYYKSFMVVIYNCNDNIIILPVL
jgi:hypothetical protein